MWSLVCGFSRELSDFPFLCAAVCISTSSSSWLNNALLCGRTTFAHLLTNWWIFGCFHFLAITKNAAMNIRVQVFVRCFRFLLSKMGIKMPNPAHSCLLE